MVKFLLLMVSVSLAGDLLFFYHPTCPYCKLQVEQFQEHGDCLQRHRLFFVNVAERSDLARAWRVYAVPVMVLKDGESYYRVDGVLVGKDLRRFLRCDAEN